jgi:hypothetical protein
VFAWRKLNAKKQHLRGKAMLFFVFGNKRANPPVSALAERV